MSQKEETHVAELADAPDLGSVEQSVREGSNPSMGTVISVKPGFWNGGITNRPFVEGYYVELFVPKAEWEANGKK